MAYITLPQTERTKTGLEAFQEGVNPYLQYAFQAMLQRKFADIQRQKNLAQAQQMMPEAFTSDYEQALKRTPGFKLDVTPGITEKFTPENWKQLYGKLTGKTTIPAQFLKFAPQAAQKYPGLGINLQTGEMEYKVPTPDIFTQMAQWEAQKGKGLGTQPITLPPSTSDEAINQAVQQYGGKPEDYTAIPIYSTGRGGLKVITGYQATLTPETEAKQKAAGQEKIKSESLVKQFSFIKEDFNTLKISLSKIPAGRIAGPQAYLQALGGGEGSEYVFNYTRDRDLILSKIAKTFGGEVGVLTEGDIKRIRDAFPPLWMNERERNFQINWIDNYIQRRIDAYSGRQPLGQIQPNLSQYSDEELTRIAGSQ